MRRLRPLLLALAVLAATPAAARAARVLYVGDSLGVGTAPYLRGLLPGTAIRADNRIGRPTPEALRVLARLLRPGDGIVVFDSGTNDDPRATAAYAARLTALRRLAGDRCLVVATLHRPPLGGAGPAGMNRVVAAFAASDPNVQVADWAAVAGPGTVGRDRVHGTARGYALRARLVGEAIRACEAAAAASQLPEPEAVEPRTIAPAPAAAPRRRPKPELPPWGPSVRRFWHPAVRDLGVVARAARAEAARIARRAVAML